MYIRIYIYAYQSYQLLMYPSAYAYIYILDLKKKHSVNEPCGFFCKVLPACLRDLSI